METVNISKRLQKISEYVLPKQPIADIGSDHAYLPIYLIQREMIPSAIVGEVAEGPLKNAQEKVSAFNLNDKISIRLGDGLTVLIEEYEVGTIFICGMGGLLIKQIIEEGKESAHLPNQARLVLQPNNKEKELREFLMANNYQIIEESIIEENNKIYEIIVAEASYKKIEYTEEQLFFGPELLKRKSDIFLKKWERIRNKNLTIRANMEDTNNSEDLQKIEQTIKRIEKVIK